MIPFFLLLSGSYNPPPSSRRESRSEAAFVNAGADINDNVGDVERSIKARMAKRDGIMRYAAKKSCAWLRDSKIF